MSNIGSTHGNQAVGGFTNTMREVGAKITGGLAAIGNKLASFGGAVASFFRRSGDQIAGAGANAHPTGATAPVLRGQSFTADEKRAHMDAALNSAFYSTMAGSTTPHLTETDFRGIAAAVLATPQSVAGMKAHGVTLDEAVAISMYTSQNFRAINDGLRTNTSKPELQGLAAAFRSGLAKLPSFDGNATTGPGGAVYHRCYRGANLPKSVADNYMIGNNIADPGIMSSTYEEKEKFGGTNFDIVLLLKPGSEGKDISMFSDKPGECEVAFPPGVNFQVIARRVDSGGLLNPAAEQTYHPKTPQELESTHATSVANLVMVET